MYLYVWSEWSTTHQSENFPNSLEINEMFCGNLEVYRFNEGNFQKLTFESIKDKGEIPKTTWINVETGENQ